MSWKEGENVNYPKGEASAGYEYRFQEILNPLSREISCDFTHMLVTEGLDLDSNTTSLCGIIQEVSQWLI